MSTSATILGILRAFDAQDAGAIAELVTPDVVFEPVSTELAERPTVHGVDALCSYLAMLATDWDEFSVAVHEVRVEGDAGVALVQIFARSGGHVADGPAGIAWRVHDGRASWGKVFNDRTEALRSVGIE